MFYKRLSVLDNYCSCRRYDLILCLQDSYIPYIIEPLFLLPIFLHLTKKTLFKYLESIQKWVGRSLVYLLSTSKTGWSHFSYKQVVMFCFFERIWQYLFNVLCTSLVLCFSHYPCSCINFVNCQRLGVKSVTGSLLWEMQKMLFTHFFSFSFSGWVTFISCCGIYPGRKVMRC
jgi:hypothetical protein